MARLDKQFSSDKVEWETPLDLFDPINDEFGFTLDVAADSSNAKCEKYLTPGGYAAEKQIPISNFRY